MLYVFGGGAKARSKMRATLATLEKRAPLAHVVRITNEDIEQVSIEDLLAAKGLFYAKRIVVFDNAFGEKTAQEKATPHLKDMARSEHIFLVLEEAPSAGLKKQLMMHATKAEISEGKEKQKEIVDWSATNALESRDAGKLWVALMKSFMRGVPAEQVHGQLFWKAKQMLLEKRFCAFTEQEVRNIIAVLAELPHTARRTGIDLEYALERLALRI